MTTDRDMNVVTGTLDGDGLRTYLVREESTVMQNNSLPDAYTFLRGYKAALGMVIDHIDEGWWQHD